MPTHLGELLKEIPRGASRARRLRTEDFGSTGEGAAKEKGGTIVRTHGHALRY